MLSKIWKNLKELIISAGVLIFVSCVLFQPFKIPSGSMIPTFLVGDFLVVNKFCYGYCQNSFRIGKFNIPCPNISKRLLASKQPARGDVVVFRNEKHNDDNFIKRIIGMPGDEIQVIDGLVHINHQPVVLKPDGEYSLIENDQYITYKKYIEVLPNGYEHIMIKRDAFGAGSLDNVGPYIVPAGHYFVMGDNRDNSTDSRVLESVGYIPLNNILGKASLIFFSSSCSLFEIFKWPFSIRFERIPTIVR